MNYHYIEIERLVEEVILPERKTPQSAGLDLYLPLTTLVKAKELTVIPMGIKV